MTFADMKLGRRPPKNAPALRLSFTGVVPTAPIAVDHFAQVKQWILGANDRYGDCGPVSVANARLLVTSFLTGTPKVVTQDDIFDLYRRSGNPNFDPITGADDNGVDMQTMLEALLTGGIGGDKPVCFAKVGLTEPELDAAIAIFGSLLLGVDLEVAQQNQTTWDYKPSSEWGGHAIVAGRYKDVSVPAAPQDRTAVVTWAEVVDMTNAFVSHQLGEAWVVIWPEHFGSKAFLEGVDLTALAADYKALTGKVLPVPAPVPVPPPAPTPGPGGCLDAADKALAVALAVWVVARHSGANKKAAKAVKTWMAAKGL